MKTLAGVSLRAMPLALALSFGAAEAVELVEVAKAPSWFATEVVEIEKGQEVKRAVHGTQAVALSMVDLDRILSAYGLSVVEVKRAPAGYMQEIVLNDRGERTVIFDPQPKGMAPVAIDGILAAYGLRVVDAQKLPETYGREVVRQDAEGKDVREVVLSSAAYAISPAEWHRILSAYGN
jgi:hypothetical protein